MPGQPMPPPPLDTLETRLERIEGLLRETARDHWPPLDGDPLHMEIMQNWVRRIVEEVAARVAGGIVEDIGKLFLETKGSNFKLHQRLDALEKGPVKP